jgi:hypothetical protein
MATRVRTIDFLPEIFRTKTNEQFLTATLDQLTQQPNFNRVQGFIGSKFGYGVNNSDAYVVEPNKVRTDYQLEPAVIFKKKDTEKAVDLLTYPGIIDSISVEGGFSNNHNLLFSNEFYSWDSFVDLDKLINYNQYYWLPEGPEAIILTTATLYLNSTFEFTSQNNSFTVAENQIKIDGSNPIITLVRGGSYELVLSQNTKFWIQTEPGTTGVNESLTNISTREVYGVINNGTSTGTITFNVPLANEQNGYLLPGDLAVDLVSTKSFSEVNGALLYTLNNIDGVADLNGKTVIFYGTPAGSQGYIGKLFDTVGFDNLAVGEFEEGAYSTITDHYYTITLIGDPANPTVKLEEAGWLQPNEKISILSGTQYVTRSFFRDSNGDIILIPALTSSLNTLYYQDESNPLRVGKIKLVDNAGEDIINVNDIIGAKTYTSPNGITLTNGMKIQFLNNVLPESYRNIQYYVEGVGTSIQLIPIRDFVVPEGFSESFVTPYDETPFDIYTYGEAAYLPQQPDYITINRGALSKNAWSRSNRWFHEDVLKIAIENNVASPISTAALGSSTARAKRPIVEFYPNIKLFNSGTIGKKPIDFINTTATDALTQVAGQTTYEPDGSGSALVDGSRIVFLNDQSLFVRNKIYVVNFVTLTGDPTPVITLSVAPDGELLENDQVVAVNGIDNKGKSAYFDGNTWSFAQQKDTVNQPPKFDVFNSSGISYGDNSFYNSTDFNGCTLFQYATGTGANDPILGFPIKYSSLSNLGDISFEVPLNTQTFNYVDGISSLTGKVSDGYVHNYYNRTEFNREIGWQTAIEKSFQYQVFSFNFTELSLNKIFKCDVAALTTTETKWVPVVVYINNARSTEFTQVVGSDYTEITITSDLFPGDTVEIMIYSNQVSKVGYYQVPDNLDHNPFNAEISNINLGDIRNHYKSICNNNRNFTGSAFGGNNFRDLGNIVPYGTGIIQNSAPLTAAAAFLRSRNNNFFKAAAFNATEYIKYKTLLVDTVDRLDLNSLQDNASILDMAIQEITTSKLETGPFFWSDMLPAGNASTVNTYTFNIGINPTEYPLTKVYDFNNANYSSVLVYLTRTINGISRTTQLIKDVDYTISSTEKSLTVVSALKQNDTIVVKEYNQTYGSYIPNTPSKLGFYPAFKPEVVYDTTYLTPTYFIKGHDGSYTKLYGEYNDGYLQDFRDRALIEFETRIYNNIKVNARIPVEYDDIFPGQFRTTTYPQEDVEQIYSAGFLNWVGTNRVEYKSQFYSTTNEFTWNYKDSISKLNNKPIEQGNWRGLYLWLYDTATPHTTPWEMLGLANKPTWWDTRYGEAPYTSDNTLLWTDISKGYIYNNGNSYINEKRVRPDLLKVLPVDFQGKLLSPLISNVAGYNSTLFKNPWTVGDFGPTEYSYFKSSSWPFDFMRICALEKPALFFTLGLNLDSYKYNTEFNQYLVDNRFRNITDAVTVYGTNATTASHSFLNWIVDYQLQYGINGSTSVFDTLQNLDVRLAYRVAGFSDKDMLKFFVEKGSPNSKNNSLLIPDESYSILLYDNQATTTVTFSSIIIQKSVNGYRVYGNSQVQAFFTAMLPINNGNFDTITVNSLSVQVSKDFSNKSYTVPYGTEFTSVKGLCEFLKGYGIYLETQGMQFTDIQNGLELNWNQMIAETLYWIQSGWEVGSTVNVNPCANVITVNKESNIVQPLTIQNENFILNQNLIPIQMKDLSVYRNGTEFSAKALNAGDSISFFTARLSTIEHVIVFDNTTVFNDILFNLVTGLRQQRLFVKGNKTAEWNGTMTASGFLLNQDNIEEWVENQKYTKGSIVKYKNNYWVASEKSAPPSNKFDTSIWIKTSYDDIQKGLLPNPSTRSYESTLYYDSNKANLESDGDLLGFSLIGYRPREYLVQGDLDDTTQVNVYMNMISTKGTTKSVTSLNGIAVQGNELSYTVNENWAIKTGEYGGILNQNFVEFTLNESELSGNPSIVSIIQDVAEDGAEQQIKLSDIKNYGRFVASSSILPLLSGVQDDVLPSAGYVNLDDVYATGYTIDRVDNNIISGLYKNDYVWIADKVNRWEIFTPISMNTTLSMVMNNLNNSVTMRFTDKHNLVKTDAFGVINFDDRINGFYTVTRITDSYSVIVDKILPNSVNTIESFGLAFKLQSMRVTAAKDINTLPLITNEYSTQKVWVDNSETGEWAVYQKENNYKNTNFSKIPPGLEYGHAVAYIPNLGYFVADPGQNQIFRYVVRDGAYIPIASLTPSGVSTTRYGTAIVKNEKFFIVSDSNPNASVSGFSYIFIYKIIETNLLQTLSLQQILSLEGGMIGDAMALSGDGNFLYLNLIEYGWTFVYRLDEDYDYVTASMTLSENTVAGEDNFIVTGNKVNSIPVGKSIAFDNTGHETVYTVIAARYNSVDDVTTFYTIEPIETVITSGTAVYTANYNFSLVEEGGVPLILGYNLTADTAADKIGFSMATNYDGSRLFLGAPYADLSETVVDTGTVWVYDRLMQSYELPYNGRAGQFAVFFLAWEPNTQAMVFVNGVRLASDQFIILLNLLVLDADFLKAGDIITVSSVDFVEPYQLYSYDDPSEARAGELFGYSVDCNTYASELLVGAPFDLHNPAGQEGAVYRFTNEGKRFGVINATDTSSIVLPSAKSIFINGFAATVTTGNASTIAEFIRYANIPNVTAESVDGRLVISLVDANLNPNNDKLDLVVVNGAGVGINYYTSLNITPYTRTQVITDPHVQSRSQFGYTVKFNEFNSFAVSAPVSTRYTNTTFDYSEDSNSHNDAVFDNNLTQWEDNAKNAGSVYMFDYINTYNESLSNISQYVYAQSCNDTITSYGAEPYYGTALAFNNYSLVIGTPGFIPDTVGGRVVIYTNNTNAQDWSVYRKSQNVVNINKIQKVQLYSNINNESLESLDYIDPLQGKLLGAVRENIDFVSPRDPAGYSDMCAFTGNKAWEKQQVGKIWFDTSTTRFLNYHQSDIEYDSKYWGQVFPGSEVAVYTWIESDVSPSYYTGNGTPYDLNRFSESYQVDATQNVVTKYYFWVKNTNKLFDYLGKTLTDTVIQSYIRSPQSSGISYMAPLKSNTFALYNSGEYIRGRNTNLHLGYSLTAGDASSHTEFKLIRTNFPDDFLPGLPNPEKGYTQPYGLYDRMLDSLAGTDEQGSMVPDPYLPKMVQSGISVRPRQSFFIDRFTALKNYFEYANTLMKTYPITEIGNLTFLNASGTDFTTSDYWETIYWWETGFDSTTRAAFDVNVYADLSSIAELYEGLVVGVKKNIQNKREVYRYSNSVWTRIGLENGTIQLLDTLWDYNKNKIGFGDNFFDSGPYDFYPSTETRYIVRALNEQIYTGSLFEHRNKSLILLFEYIQSENISNNNYMPWLNKTSLIDVGYTVRDLLPYQKYKRDNQSFLEGYVNEIKPYHVVIKDFYLRYTGFDEFDGDISDFDLPSKYSSTVGNFVSPQLKYNNYVSGYQFLPTDAIWQEPDYKQWYDNYGLTLKTSNNAFISTLEYYISIISAEVYLSNPRGVPVQGTIRIDDELISYIDIDRDTGKLLGVSRGVNGTLNAEHFKGAKVFSDLPEIIILDTGRDYIEIPTVTAYIDTSIYPAPKKPAVLKAVMSADKVIAVQTIDPGEGYVTTPEIIFGYSQSFTETSDSINLNNNTLIVRTDIFDTGELIKFETKTGAIGIVPDGYYYVRVISDIVFNGSTAQVLSLHTNKKEALLGHFTYPFNASYSSSGYEFILGISARAIPTVGNTRVRGLSTTLRFDRTSYQSNVEVWVPGGFWASPFNSPETSASTSEVSSVETPVSTVGTVLDITDVTADVNGTAILEIDYSTTTLEPGQIKGQLLYVYKTYAPYVYNDPSDPGYDNTLATITITRPTFNPNNITREYEYYIAPGEEGTSYSDGDTVTILGSLLGGVDGTNDAVITISYVTNTGGIQLSSIQGTPVSEFESYYLNPISSTELAVYENAKFTVPAKEATFAFAAGDQAFIPEPLTNNSSLVSYNNKIYRCIQSNSDTTFDYTKWVEVDLSSTEVNALDRIMAFYQPTMGMPGKDLGQLVNGVTYPNNVYYGNSFAPEEELPIDYIVKDLPFTPTGVNIKSIIYDGSRYVAVADTDDSTLVLVGDETEWSMLNIANKVLTATEISFINGVYIITTNTNDVPILISYDATRWITVGEYSPFDTLPFDIDAFSNTQINSTRSALQSTASFDNKFFAVGSDISKSDNAVNWTQAFSFNSNLPNKLNFIDYFNIPNFTGLVAVGSGQVAVSGIGTAAPVVETVSRIVTSLDGNVWTIQTPNISTVDLFFVFSSTSLLVTGGENSEIWTSTNAHNWDPATISGSAITDTLRSGAFGNGVYVIVGDNGTILYSSDGVTYSQATDSNLTTQHLSEVIYDGAKFYAVGYDNTVLTSTDGQTWINQSDLNQEEPDYTIKGNDFLFGYGPEELVAGVVSDNLIMTVTSIDGSLETRFILIVTKTGESHVYRVNNPDTAYIVSSPLTINGDVLYVDDVTKINGGNTILIGTEMIRFTSVDVGSNTVSGLIRGVGGTSPTAHDIYDLVYPLNSTNMLPDMYYDETWNSWVIDTLYGDPLTQSTTPAAIFLNTV